MNYKVAKTMLGLCIGYLAVFYVLKFRFPELLLQAITSPTLLRLGEFINGWVGWSHFINFGGTFLTLYLFASASSGNLHKTKREWIAILGGMILTAVFYYLLPELYTHSVSAIMLIVACFCKGKMYYATISFTIHGTLSQLLLTIRGYETIIVYMDQVGTLSGLILGTEMYVWLILLSILFYFKEKKNDGNDMSSLPQQEQEVS